jgi:hypothetical protein
LTVRFLTNDGQFGLLVSQEAGLDMFRFQLIVDSRLVGDREPCIIGSAMRQLANVSSLSDLGFDPVAAEPSLVAEILCSDEELHDSVTLPLAESLDGWLIFALVHEGKFIMVAQECRNVGPGGEVIRSIADLGEYSSIISAASGYWRALVS